MKFKNQNYSILIAPTHIPELNAVEHTSDGIKFGASVTLTTLEDVLNEACHSMPGTNAQFCYHTSKLSLQLTGVSPLERAGWRKPAEQVIYINW